MYLYQNKKDKRSRIVYKDEEGKLHTKSYPRYLMEQKLGRPLKPNEDVHHIDGDVTNNNLDNLEIVLHGEHQKRHNPNIYFDKIAICAYCGKEFLWLAKQQQRHYSNAKRRENMQKDKVFCSKQCVGKFGKEEQICRNANTECK